MLNRPTTTEKIIRALASFEEVFYLPKSDSQFARWFDGYAFRDQRRGKMHRQRVRKRVREALNRLKKTCLLSYRQESDSYRLTSKGWVRYLYYCSSHRSDRHKMQRGVSKKKFLIIFDIPEEHRQFRDLLRKSLQNQGCRMIQKSVFSCPNEVVYKWARKVVFNCELEGHVLFIEADRVD